MQSGPAIAAVSAITVKVIRETARPAIAARGIEGEVVIPRTEDRTSAAITAVTTMTEGAGGIPQCSRQVVKPDPCRRKR